MQISYTFPYYNIYNSYSRQKHIYLCDFPKSKSIPPFSQEKGRAGHHDLVGIREPSSPDGLGGSSLSLSVDA